MVGFLKLSLKWSNRCLKLLASQASSSLLTLIICSHRIVGHLAGEDVIADAYTVETVLHSICTILFYETVRSLKA